MRHTFLFYFDDPQNCISPTVVSLLVGRLSPLFTYCCITLHLNISRYLVTAAVPARAAGNCFKGGEHMICLPRDYQKYDLPRQHGAVKVVIEVHIKDIPKVRLHSSAEGSSIIECLQTTMIIISFYCHPLATQCLSPAGV